MGCPTDFRRQQRERWIPKVMNAMGTSRLLLRRDIAEKVVDLIQADLRESQAAEAQEIERLRSAIQHHLDTFGYDNHEGLADALVGDPE